MVRVFKSIPPQELESGTLTSANNDNAGGANLKCPICKSAAIADYVPFCSKRCADVDLHRWLSGSYAIPAEESESDGLPEDGDEGV